jgi:hypothetical protein
MDPLSVSPGIISVINFAVRFTVTTKFVYPAWEVITLHRLRKNYGSLKQKFGMLQALALI